MFCKNFLLFIGRFGWLDVTGCGWMLLDVAGLSNSDLNNAASSWFGSWLSLPGHSKIVI